METASTVLREEHKRILGVVEVFEKTLDHAAFGGSPDLDRLADCVTFFRLFADACHHGKEESLLFAELEGHGLPRDAGPIAVMLEEHRLGRAMVKEMVEALPGAREGNARAREALDRNARNYIELIRAHIGKEDNVLFMMADQLVAGAACHRLCTAYKGADCCQFEHHTKAELENLATRLMGARPIG